MARKITPEERARIEAVVSSIPKVLYCEWTGRSHQTLGQQAERHGWQGIGKRIDLRLLLKSIHDWVAKARPKASINRENAEAVLEAKKRKLVAQAEKEELLVAQLQGRLIDRGDVLAAAQDYASLVAQAIERVRRTMPGEWATEINEALLQGLEEFVAKLDRVEVAPVEDEDEDEEGEESGSPDEVEDAAVEIKAPPRARRKKPRS